MTGVDVDARRPPGTRRLPAPVGSAEAARRGMRWLYLLIALMLSSTGAGVGQLIFMVNDIGHIADVNMCLRDQGHLLAVRTAKVTPGDWAGFKECVAPYNSGHGRAMLIGAVAIPLVAWWCMVLGGLRVRRRLRRSAVEIDRPRLTVLAGRFGYWCGAIGLPERDRPTLLVGWLSRHTRRAFTTSVPFRRPVMMIPSAYTYLSEEQVDLVLLHELAHVRP